MCGRCRSVGYCNKECQTKDWRGKHKAACVKGENKLAGTAFKCFPNPSILVGDDKFLTYDNDCCIGQKSIKTDSLNYLSDAKFGKAEAGKLTVILFWAQYSKPGYKFFPLYSQLQAKYGSKIQFVGVSIDPDSSYPTKFLEDPGKKYSTVFNIDFAVAHDEGKVLKKFYEDALRDTLSLPHAFVLDKEGTIVWHQDHSELSAAVPNYMHLMEKQLDALVAGQPLDKVGDKEEESDDEDEGDEGEGMDIGDFDDCF